MPPEHKLAGRELVSNLELYFSLFFFFFVNILSCYQQRSKIENMTKADMKKPVWSLRRLVPLQLMIVCACATRTQTHNAELSNKAF